MSPQQPVIPLQSAHEPLPEPVRDPIIICRSCGGCVTEKQPLPCQQESCGGTWGSAR